MTLSQRLLQHVTILREIAEPISVLEVSTVVLNALAAESGDRPLDVGTARHGLAHPAFDLIQLT
jgi:hypothetical protein